MIFNKHLELEGRHAILSPSKPYWLNYDDESLDHFNASVYATDIGTLVHEYACDRIRFKLPVDIQSEEAKSSLLVHLLKNGIPFRVIELDRLFLNVVPYINDAIGYQMEPEVKLKYSELCFGTADTIGVRRNQLRVHDLKTGTSPAHMDQLLIYSALFFHEYKRDYKPQTMKVELRIYQNGEFIVHQPDTNEIVTVMDKIVHDDKVLSGRLSGT